MPDLIRVLSVPSRHVYVDHLADPDGDEVTRLPDPVLPGRAEAAPWWPPVALEAQWVLDHADEFDVFHVHFGFDARRRSSCATWSARAAPHGHAARLHGPRPAQPAPRASALRTTRNSTCWSRPRDALITLTPGAAAVIEERWGRRATVLPHPHVVDEPALSRPRPVREEFVVGVHLKSLRASMDPLPVVEVAGQGPAPARRGPGCGSTRTPT